MKQLLCDSGLWALSLCQAKATTRTVYFVACSWSLEQKSGLGWNPAWDPSAHQGVWHMRGGAPRCPWHKGAELTQHKTGSKGCLWSSCPLLGLQTGLVGDHAPGCIKLPGQASGSGWAQLFVLDPLRSFPLAFPPPPCPSFLGFLG